MSITFIFVLQLLALILAWVGKRERAVVTLSISLLIALCIFISNIDSVTSIVL